MADPAEAPRSRFEDVVELDVLREQLRDVEADRARLQQELNHACYECDKAKLDRNRAEASLTRLRQALGQIPRYDVLLMDGIHFLGMKVKIGGDGEWVKYADVEDILSRVDSL